MTLAKKNLDKPDETRPFQAHGNMAVVAIGDATGPRDLRAGLEVVR